MLQQTNDKEQLKGILKKFDLSQAKAVLEELTSDLMPKVTDYKNQGKRCSHGQDGCIGKEEIERNIEAWYDQYNFLSAHFLTEGAEVQKAIAMVTLKVAKGVLLAGSGWGSGFLVSNSLFMTNNHVVPNKAFCDDVNMQFMYQDNYNTEPAISSEFFETNEDSFFHTNAGLDYTIVRLKRKPYKFINPHSPFRLGEDNANLGFPANHEYADSEQIEELKYLSEFITKKQPISVLDPSRVYQIFGYTPGSKYGYIQLRPTISYPVGLRLNVIQHPRGRKKEVVVQQNKLTDVHTNVIHYYSDTDYGSSGSPVFNNQWDLMALHHAREPSESANEGIRIDKIVADLRSEFQTSNPGILTELGI
jgi:endonuclease G, mitochondrial